MNDRIDALFRRWKRRETPGCIVAVARGGRVLHRRGYGMADVELGVPITAASVFHVASISKQITGYLALMLEDERRLRLDDDVRRFVPEVPRFAARITLRHLLHHTSGLRDHFTLMKLSGVRPMDEKSERDILELVARQTTLNFAPGTSFNYCNTGYALLAVAMSRILGVPFRVAVRQKIFRPLGMNDSLVRDDHTTLVARRARAYDDSGAALGLSMPNFDFAGSTGVCTTAGDLLRWADHLLRPPRRAAGRVARLLSSGRLADGTPVHYGAGVELTSYRGLEVVQHRGFDLGYSASLMLFPRARLAVAILGNVSTLPAAALGHAIADICLARAFPAPRPARRTPSVADLRRAAGLYRHPVTGRAYWITLSDRTLHLSAEPNARGVTLRPLSATRFQAETETAEITLDGDALTIGEDAGVAQRYVRAAPWAPPARALSAFAGAYRCAELGERLTFRVVDGRLVAKRRRWPARGVTPAYRDAFTDDIATYRFVRRGRRVVAVVLTLDRVYRLRYERESARAIRSRS